MNEVSRVRHTDDAHQYVVWFDVSMEDMAAFQEFEGQKELLTVGTNCLDVQPHVFTILLKHFPQIHADRNTLKNSCELLYFALYLHFVLVTTLTLIFVI